MRQILYLGTGIAFAVSLICFLYFCNNVSTNDKSDEAWSYSLMKAGGHSFGYRGDITMWEGWYYDSIPVGDDYMLKYDSVGPSKLHLSLVTRDIIVDLESENAKKEIMDFLGPINGFKRFKNTYEITLDSIVDEYGKMICSGRFSFVADYVDSSHLYAEKINQFVCRLAAASSFADLDDSYLTSHFLSKNKSYHPEVKDSVSFDIDGLSDYIFDRTVEYWKQDDEYDPYIGSMGADIAIRAHIANRKFITFGLYSYDRVGSGHGMYYVTFYSFDLESGEELSNNTLFIPGSQERIKSLLFDVMAKDVRYSNSNNVKTAQDVRDLIEGSKEDSKFTLPFGALTNSGIVFSFQPYEIDCWAAGTYHFIVPYTKLMPYLTPKAKLLIE